MRNINIVISENETLIGWVELAVEGLDICRIPYL